MSVSAFFLKDFCGGDLELSINKDVTFLIGKNGSGKTQAICALCHLLGSASLLKPSWLDDASSVVIDSLVEQVLVFAPTATDACLRTENIKTELAKLSGYGVVVFLDSINKMFDGCGEFRFNELTCSLEQEISPGFVLSLDDIADSMKRMVWLFAAVINSKAKTVLLMDDPELGLHIHCRSVLVDLILECNPTIQVIAATHCPSVISKHADKIIHIR